MFLIVESHCPSIFVRSLYIVFSDAIKQNSVSKNRLFIIIIIINGYGLAFSTVYAVHENEFETDTN